MEGATCSSCAPDGSRESVKRQVRQERLFFIGKTKFITNTADVATSKFLF